MTDLIDEEKARIVRGILDYIERIIHCQIRIPVCISVTDLTVEQRRQVEFVQFHPSYDYSDFVEGLRPKMKDGDTLGFELRDGVFKAFVQ